MDGKSVNYQVWPTTVGAFLRANGIVLFEADEVSCPLDAKLKEGMKISIVRAFPVAVESGGGVMGGAKLSYDGNYAGGEFFSPRRTSSRRSSP